MIYAKYDLAYGDDVYDYMGERLKLEGETENMGVWTKRETMGYMGFTQNNRKATVTGWVK